MKTKYILQFSSSHGGGEYLVIVDEKPTKAIIADWMNKGDALDAIYEADIECLTKGHSPDMLPTESILEVR